MKKTAKEAFEQLAEAYLVASNRSHAAQSYVDDLRYKHNLALNDYYYVKGGQEHSKKAFKNDVKGLANK